MELLFIMLIAALPVMMAVENITEEIKWRKLVKKYRGD